MKSNISSDMNKPCWKLAKACQQSKKLFCFRENNLLVIVIHTYKQDEKSTFTYGSKYVSVRTPVT